MQRLLIALVVSASLPACGSDPRSPAVADPDGAVDAGTAPDGGDPDADDGRVRIPEPPPARPTRYLRVELTRSGAAVAAPRLTVVDSPFELPTYRVGDHVVVGYAGDRPIAAQPFHFASEVLSEGRGLDGRPLQRRRESTRGEATVLVPLPADAALDRITVLDDRGAVLTEVAVPSARASLRARASSTRALDIPGAPDLVIVTPAMAGDLPPDLRVDIDEVVSVADLPQAHQDVIVSAFAAMAPRTRAAVTHLVVARLRDGGFFEGEGLVLGSTKGSFVMINADELATADMRGVLIHEAAHAYDHLLFNPRASAPLWQWPQPIRDLAAATIEANQLQIDFDFLWQQAHTDAIADGATTAYVGPGWTRLEDDAARAGGFVEPYGAHSPAEDIATYAAALQLAGNGDLVLPLCEELRSAPGNRVPQRLYIPYLKIMMLANAGFVSKAAAESCYGAAALHGPEGIVLHRADDTVAMTLDRNVTGGWLTQDGGEFVGVLADGPSGYRMMIRIEARRYPWQPTVRVPPLGLHRLDAIGIRDIRQVNNAVYLANEESNPLARTSAGGLALVSSVSPDRYEIVVFHLKLRNQFGRITDHFPLATFVHAP